jgi:hypothetical protein
VDDLTTLPQLAERIKAAHLGVGRHLAAALEKAREAGELLRAAKRQLGHGCWLPWLSANCAIPERTAQIYMRVARNWPQIEAHPCRERLTLQEAASLTADGTHDLEGKSATVADLPKRAPMSEEEFDRRLAEIEADYEAEKRAIVAEVRGGLDAKVRKGRMTAAEATALVERFQADWDARHHPWKKDDDEADDGGDHLCEDP